ncbi:MAG: LLM class flavin-dependent oxidoreductase [Chloroflexi bacterium]|nr:LLM class flavin-dependent oxidoreductase [Chloroflexota bacterium]
MEIGVYTFGELAPDPVTGRTSPGERIRDLVEEIVLADEVGLDVFGVGEHHRPDFAVSAPAVVLAAAAERTSRIRLTSAVSVISSDDPVRVFEEFATLDLLSGGRAEIMAGRGSFIESFPLFGYDLRDYDALFAEKLDLLLRIRAAERVSWSGGHRAAIDDRGVYPRPIQDPLPVWIAVGGTPESAWRAGSLGLPMALAIIGGLPERFAPFAEIHRQAAREAGHVPPPALSINSHGYLADTTERAAEEAYPPLATLMDRIARERGFAPLDRASYDASRTLRGANFVGSPQEVIDKILFQHDIFHHDRFLLQMIGGGMPHAQVMRSIELLGTIVAPAVRTALGTAPAG